MGITTREWSSSPKVHRGNDRAASITVRVLHERFDGRTTVVGRCSVDQFDGAFELGSRPSHPMVMAVDLGDTETGSPSSGGHLRAPATTPRVRHGRASRAPLQGRGARSARRDERPVVPGRSRSSTLGAAGRRSPRRSVASEAAGSAMSVAVLRPTDAHDVAVPIGSPRPSARLGERASRVSNRCSIPWVCGLQQPGRAVVRDRASPLGSRCGLEEDVTGWEGSGEGGRARDRVSPALGERLVGARPAGPPSPFCSDAR